MAKKEPKASDKNMLLNDSIQGIEVLSASAEHIKSRLRSKISRNLIKNFAIPEIVEGLVEYFMDVIQDDPAQAKMLGVLD